MTTSETESLSVYTPHPVFGKYVSHHPSDRIRLIVRGGVIYAVLVIIIQALFWNVPDDTAQVVLPVLFGITALGTSWYVAHLWNREVILYERGFTYREGSKIGHFRYQDIVRIRHQDERTAHIELFYAVHYVTLLTSNEDELLRINNIYSNTAKLIKRLEAYITRDHLPYIREKIAQGESVHLGGDFRMSQSGIEYNGKELFWHELKDREISGGQLILKTDANTVWNSISVAELDNVILVLALLKAYVPDQSEQTELS